jgi:RNA-directed DNA polymerase
MYDLLCSWENLHLAYQKASRGKRGQACIASFEYRLEKNLLQLQRELVEKSYRPGGYESFYIHDPKRRLISAAPFRDRVVHHALCNLIEPVFERSFIFDSYANRVGKGTHRALERATQFSRRYHYVLSCDVRQFFPSIDHALLRRILARKIQSSELLWLIDQILTSGVGVLSDEYEMVYFTGDDLFSIARPRGLPIGNLTSQFWANCYLSPFDHFVKRELGCKGYIRYVDDFLLFGDDKKELTSWRHRLIEKLAEFRLTLHENSAWPCPVDAGFPFLGFIIYPTHRRLKRHRGIAFARRLRRLKKDYARHLIPFEKLDASIKGWVNHVRYGDTWRLRCALLVKSKR